MLIQKGFIAVNGGESFFVGGHFNYGTNKPTKRGSGENELVTLM